MTTPYVTGTVSVTAGSAIVTGVGTGWQTAGLVAGQFGLDSANGNPIPVLSVDSDTQITLAKPWRGTTASGQAYWITYDTQPGQQTVANAQMLALYLSRLDKPALAALASLVPAADKLPYFGANGAGALADFNAAARALLAGGVLPNAQLPARIRSDAVDVSTDFNTALENGFYLGGTASTNAPATGVRLLMFVQRYNANYIVQTAWQVSTTSRVWTRTLFNGTWTAWQLVSLPVLGTVSQSSGIPTGAIIERGSNANGEYVRYADGTQICWYGGISFTKAAGNVEVQWVYPIAFSAVPLGWVNANARSADGGTGRTAYFMGHLSSTLTQTNIIISQLDGATAQSGTWSNNRVFAIGRWF